MNTGERVRELRKSLGMTLEKFSERLGVSKAAISNIERGERALTEQMIVSISREYGVNGDWLRTGEGEMKAPKTKESELAEITAQLFKKSQVDEQTYNFIAKLSEILLDMNEAQMQLVFDAIRKLNAAISEPEEKKE